MLKMFRPYLFANFRNYWMFRFLYCFRPFCEVIPKNFLKFTILNQEKFGVTFRGF